jgi:hypothetical protein
MGVWSMLAVIGPHYLRQLCDIRMDLPLFRTVALRFSRFAGSPVKPHEAKADMFWPSLPLGV